MADEAPPPEEVERMLASLEAGERAILEYRFGLGDDRVVHTLDESARRFVVSRDHVREVEAKALANLRRPPPA